jgi:hypothetical protein
VFAARNRRGHCAIVAGSETDFGEIMRLLFQYVLPGVLLCPCSLFAQTEINDLIVRLRGQLQASSLIEAAKTADQLSAATTARYHAWLVSDSNERADEVLSWLPPETEGFWVNRRPLEPPAERDPETAPLDWYLFDRLKGQDDGRYYKLLDARMVRMVMAAVRTVPSPNFETMMMPGPIASQEVIYFYFLTAALNIGPADEVVNGSPLWRGTGRITERISAVPFTTPLAREDTNWLALPKPDLLILSSRKELLLSVLTQMSNQPSTRPLPSTLPEWQYVDRSSDFWGLRHFSQQSKPKAGERGCITAELPFPDCRATGATVRYEAASGAMKIRYLSPANIKPLREVDFKVTRPGPGEWEIDTDAVSRGPIPAYIGLAILGFGDYR